MNASPLLNRTSSDGWRRHHPTKFVVDWWRDPKGETESGGDDRGRDNGSDGFSVACSPRLRLPDRDPRTGVGTLISQRGTDDLHRGDDGSTAPRDVLPTEAVLAPTDKPALPIVNDPPDRRLWSELVEVSEASSPRRRRSANCRPSRCGAWCTPN